MIRNLWIGILVVILFAGGELIPFRMSGNAIGEESKAIKPMYTIHEPCRINSDSDFSLSSCVTGGNGTQNNPYRIEGWDINGTERGYALFIGNTTLFFIVQNSYFHDILTYKNNFYNTGIELYHVSNGIISNNLLLNNNPGGIKLDRSNNISVINNNASNNHNYGICLTSANDNVIYNNTISSNRGAGISFNFYKLLSERNLVINNVVYNNSWTGINVAFASNNTISENRIINNGYGGISIWESTNNSYSKNQFTNDGFIIIGNSFYVSSTQYIDTTNLVNGKPVYYYNNLHGGRAPVDAGQVILVNVTNMTISDLTISNVEYGLQIEYSSHNSILRNTFISNEYYGAFFHYSNDNMISDNKFMDNSKNLDYLSSGAGLYTDFSNDNDFFNNIIANNKLCGIKIENSMNDQLSNNSILNNSRGIELWHTSHVEIVNTTLVNNFIGINSYDSSEMKIHDNKIEKNEEGISFQSSFENDVASNEFNQNNFSILFYFNSDNNSIISNQIKNGWSGISFANGPNINNKILQNSIINHSRYGIYSYSSISAEIALNIIADNELQGIYLAEDSKQNMIHHNTFRNNNKTGDKQAIDISGNNSWNTSSEGNRWSDFDEPSEGCNDNDFNGICDSPYLIAGFKGIQDHYPLTQNVFSTYLNVQVMLIILLIVIFVVLFYYLIMRKRRKLRKINK